jgi:transketolase
VSKVPQTLETLCINTIRGLAIDGVQAANSGHPGLPLGAAAMAYTIWTKHLKHDPHDPKWFNRDRFILSAGHGSMLLYSLLHLTGYDLPLEELKKFRQWGSKTPGHPENTITPGVEMATGPLGQGISTAVGIALAEKYLASHYNKNGSKIIDHYTIGICSDGDLMEGVSNEACSLAGHLGLGKLIFLYDDNKITIDGGTDRSFTEDVEGRLKAQGWHTQRVDGFDVAAIDAAITAAKAEQNKPSLILCRTIIGFGSPNKAGSPKVHGAPLGEEELKLTKKQLGLPEDQSFYINAEALKVFRQAEENGARANKAWHDQFADYAKKNPKEAACLEAQMRGELPCDLWSDVPSFTEKIATRSASGKVLNAIAAKLPTLLGGTADLAESNMTELKGYGLFSKETPDSRNIAYGIREHAMGAIMNGITLHGGCRAFGGTFMVFSDYCRPSVRLAALMHTPSIFVFTHDSIGLGEDGPTHQPIEHLLALRAIPNLNVMRPADGNETTACWKVALENKSTPSVLALSRQALPPVTPTDIETHPAQKGAYILSDADSGAPRLVIIATGSEVQPAIEAKKLLESEGIATRVVNMPSTFLFEQQSVGYQKHVLPSNVPTVSVEAGSTIGWSKYAGASVGIDRFGASAPGPKLMTEFGFTPENIARVARELFNKHE